MNQGLKIGLYILLVAGCVIFGSRLYRSWTDFNKPVPVAAPAEEDKEAPTATNKVDSAAADSTNNVPAENQTETQPAPDVATNAAPASTKPGGAKRKTTTAASVRGSKTGAGELMANLGLFLACVIGLGIMMAYDWSRYFAGKTEEFLFNDEGKGQGNPEYEEAEKIWANGDHLEAIRMMREYLQRNPREQYVALRIAEIYEKDLANPLAAALEYEEVLKKKLPDERWGWAAIHLANLYSGKLGRVDDALTLLRRIDSEYGHTAAASKARKRLAQFDQTGEVHEEPPPA